jgi:hypothetical protein
MRLESLYKLIRILAVLIVSTMGLAGCITSERPIFGPEDANYVVGFRGKYTVIGDSNDKYEALISRKDSVYIITTLGCKSESENNRSECSFSIIAVRLPSSHRTYVLAVPAENEKPDGRIRYQFMYWAEQRWSVCEYLGKGRNNADIDESASLYGLDYVVGEFQEVEFVGDITPENMLGFLDTLWLKAPRDAWGCFYLEPEDRSR